MYLTMAAKIKPKIAGIFFGPKMRPATFGMMTKLAATQEKSKNDQMAYKALAAVPPSRVTKA